MRRTAFRSTGLATTPSRKVTREKEILRPLDLRSLTIIALILTLLDFVYGFLIWGTLDDTQIELLSFNGVYGLFEIPDWLWYGSFGLQVVILASLILGFSWARPAFLLFLVWFVISTLLFGVGISMPSRMFLGTLQCLLYGAIAFALIGGIPTPVREDSE